MENALVYALVIHLIADWLLQNHWMAVNKMKLGHPAGILHTGIHAGGMLLIFPLWAALLIGITHYIIDLRFPLAWWRKFYRQTTEGDYAIHVAIWGDQVAHIAIIALISLLVA